MSYVTGSVTLGSTGSANINLGFQPTWARFTVAGKAGDTVSHTSVGATDGSNQWVASTFGDGTSHASFSNQSKVVSHYERISGTVTEKLAASFTGFYASGVTLNVTAATSGYSVFIEAGA